MPIQDLCQKNLISVERGASLQYAAQLMKKHHVGGIVVIEADGVKKPLGVLTDRDIVLAVVAENRSLSTPISEIMSKDIVTVTKGSGIASAIDQMEQKGVRRIIVIDEAGDACGLVSSDDILQLLAREMYGLGKLVEKQVANEPSYKTNKKEISLLL